MTPLHDDPHMTPMDGISEVMLDDLLRRSHELRTPPGLLLPKQKLIGSTVRVQLRLMQPHNHHHQPKPFEPETPSSILTQNSSDDSVQTDASVANNTANDDTGLSTYAAAGVMATPNTGGSSHNRVGGATVKREPNCLVTFQRTIDKEHMVQTTLHAKADGANEDTMADLVRRLQKSTTGSAVPLFAKKDLKKVTKGKRQILFHLPQVHKALSFSKDEFGPMKISKLMKLTPQRPIVVEINLERIISGDQIDIFWWWRETTHPIITVRVSIPTKKWRGVHPEYSHARSVTTVIPFFGSYRSSWFYVSDPNKSESEERDY